MHASRARPVLDRLIAVVEETGFGAHEMHVQVGGETSFWDADVPRSLHSVATAMCVLAAGLASDNEVVFDVDAPVSRYLRT